ncbi:hypothetical protein Megpolyxen_01387 [Candidatus Megaera polyxenophila]|nr:hypothetical protein Megpolyxen_01387 [Candidatus Megaera polyxenophila]
MTKFKIFASVFRFILCTGVGGVIDHYLGITKLLINIVETIVGNFDIMNELLASWILIIWLGLTIMFISDKIGFTKWVYSCLKKTRIDTWTVTQPAKPKQQLDKNPLSKFLKDASKNRKEFEKRSNEIAKNLNHKE